MLYNNNERSTIIKLFYYVIKLAEKNDILTFDEIFTNTGYSKKKVIQVVNRLNTNQDLTISDIDICIRVINEIIGGGTNIGNKSQFSTLTGVDYDYANSLITKYFKEV